MLEPDEEHVFVASKVVSKNATTAPIQTVGMDSLALLAVIRPQRMIITNCFHG